MTVNRGLARAWRYGAGEGCTLYRVLTRSRGCSTASCGWFLKGRLADSPRRAPNSHKVPRAGDCRESPFGPQDVYQSDGAFGAPQTIKKKCLYKVRMTKSIPIFPPSFFFSSL